MNGQAKKNLRQALPGAEFGTKEHSLMLAASTWLSRPDPKVDAILFQLGLLDIAQRCLISGETLEEVGSDGPYGSTAQRRAWAAGKLSSACEAMILADQIVEERKAAVISLAEMTRKYEYARAETRAAARYKEINVPFREKPKRSVNWEAV